MTDTSTFHYQIDNHLFIELNRHLRRMVRCHKRNQVMDSYLDFQLRLVRHRVRMLYWIITSYGYRYQNKPNGHYELVSVVNDLLNNERFFNEDIQDHEEMNRLTRQVILAVDGLMDDIHPLIDFTVHLN